MQRISRLDPWNLSIPVCLVSESAVALLFRGERFPDMEPLIMLLPALCVLNIFLFRRQNKSPRSPLALVLYALAITAVEWGFSTPAVLFVFFVLLPNAGDDVTYGLGFAIPMLSIPAFALSAICFACAALIENAKQKATPAP